MIKFAQNKVCELQLELAYDAFLFIVAYLFKKKEGKTAKVMQDTYTYIQRTGLGGRDSIVHKFEICS